MFLLCERNLAGIDFIIQGEESRPKFIESLGKALEPLTFNRYISCVGLEPNMCANGLTNLPLQQTEPSTLSTLYHCGLLEQVNIHMYTQSHTYIYIHVLVLKLTGNNSLLKCF